MAGQPPGGGLTSASKGVGHLEASLIKQARLQGDLKAISGHERPAKIGAAMHDRQGNAEGRLDAIRGRLRPWGLSHRPLRPWKNLGCTNAEALQALLIGLMAPAQQLVELDHAGGVGVAEADRALQP